MTKVSPLYGRTGREVANQYVINTPDGDYFQSYDSIIAFRDHTGRITLDRTYWDYSRTTSKHLAQFLGMSCDNVRKAVKAEDFVLVDFN